MRFQYLIGCPVVFAGTRYSFQIPGLDSDSIKSGFVSALQFSQTCHEHVSSPREHAKLFAHDHSSIEGLTCTDSCCRCTQNSPHSLSEKRVYPLLVFVPLSEKISANIFTMHLVSTTHPSARLLSTVQQEIFVRGKFRQKRPSGSSSGIYFRQTSVVTCCSSVVRSMFCCLSFIFTFMNISDPTLVVL